MAVLETSGWRAPPGGGALSSRLGWRAPPGGGALSSRAVLETSGWRAPPGGGALSSRTPRPLRVAQIDSDELDQGLVSLLSETLERSIRNFQSSFTLDIKPEIGLVLKLLILNYGLFATQSTPGTRLQNLKYVNAASPSSRLSRRQLLLYLLLHPPLFPSYLLTRLRRHALSRQWPDLPPHEWRRKAWDLLVRVENAAKMWELAGWLGFLWDGKYPSLMTRILRMQLVPSSNKLTRMVSYEYMNRQLVWGAFTVCYTLLIPMHGSSGYPQEFLFFALPLLPAFPRLSPFGFLSILHPPEVDYSSLLATTTKASPSSSTRAHSGLFATIPKETCPLCHLRSSTNPVALGDSGISLPPLGDQKDEGKEENRIYVPAQTDCWGTCRYCYYCIMGELAGFEEKRREKSAEASETWECLRCGGGVTKAWRVGAEET
ncbi:peroxin-2, partial [Tremellales sp. Uapishka_1]